MQLDSYDANIGLVLGTYGSNYTNNASLTNSGGASFYSTNNSPLNLMVSSNLDANVGYIRFAKYIDNTNTFTEFGRITKSGTFAMGTTSPSASLLMDLQSTTQGFAPPRMTAAQAEAISSKAEGLMLYSGDGGGVSITSKGWWGWDGAAWVKLG